MNIFKTMSAIGLGLLVSAGSASAAIQTWNFQDDDIDFLLDSNYNLKAPDGSGNTLDVGDILFAVFTIDQWTIDLNNAIPAGQELTGVNAIQVVSKNDNNGDGLIDQVVFGAVAGGLDPVIDAILGAGTAASLFTDNGGTSGAGSSIAMFLNGMGVGSDRDLELSVAVNPATNCTSLADCTEQATLGSLLQIDGFLGDGDESWTANIIPGVPGDDIDTLHQVNNGVNFGAVNFALSNIYNTVNPVLFQPVLFGDCSGATSNAVADGCAQLVGSANIIGGAGLSNGAFAHSDFDGNKLVQVPEPSTIALLGLGLLAFGSRMKKGLAA